MGRRRGHAIGIVLLIHEAHDPDTKGSYYLKHRGRKVSI